MTLRHFFHLMHMVDDFDEAEALFVRVFDPDVFMAKSWSDLDKRWASLARIGPDFVIEIMEASTDDADAHLPIPKFVHRFGHRLHSFSWYIAPEDVAPMFRRLRSQGIRVAGPAGLLADDIADEDLPPFIFTHARDTYGQIELWSPPPGSTLDDPLFDPTWDHARWSDAHPLGIMRTAHMTNAVDDLERAKRVFGEVLGGTVFHETSDASSERAYVLVGVDTVIELARPIDPTSRLARDMAANGPLPHMATFRVRDLAAACAHLERCGVSIGDRSDDTVVVDPTTMFGALLAFTTADLPGDPRL